MATSTNLPFSTHLLPRSLIHFPTPSSPPPPVDAKIPAPWFFFSQGAVLGLPPIKRIVASISCPIMSKNVRLRKAASTRQQPLLENSVSFAGEVIGETTAECAVICCCFPCAVANLLVLAIYKVPAGLCRRALRKNRKRVLPPRRHRCSCGCDDTENQIHPNSILDVSDLQKSPELDKELQQLEKEMWERFYGTGFWRSQSQRESSDNITGTKPRFPVSAKWEISRVPYL